MARAVFTILSVLSALQAGGLASEAPRRVTEFRTVMGTVKAVDSKAGTLTIVARNGNEILTCMGINTVFEVIRNLDNTVPDPLQPADISGRLERYTAAGQLVVIQGIHQEAGGRSRFDARHVYLTSGVPGRFAFEDDSHWWIKQITNLANEWLDDLFGDGRTYSPDHFASSYRTNLNFLGKATEDGIQECSTLSRLIYGLCSAYLLTGNDRYFQAARAGVSYQRQTFRILGHDGRHCFWAYGLKKTSHNSRLIVPSQNKDDLGTIPLYEQIYALAGLTQYYRISLDPEVLEDIRLTLNTFNDYYRDRRLGGFFSHIAEESLRYDDPVLGPNLSRKNWNSIGDHIPAYLVNLVLALDPLPAGRGDLEAFRVECLDILDMTATAIAEKFPDPDPTVPYVIERFHADWTPDLKWGWQLDRGIIGHNLKIAWNLARVANFYLAGERGGSSGNSKANLFFKVAKRLGTDMASQGVDTVHGGVFDIVERRPGNGMPLDFPWSDTKEFWQQEQGILAYLILHGCDGAGAKAAGEEVFFLSLAREIAAFWNLFFLDRDNCGVIFRVNDNGLPVLSGDYNKKGGHAISGYHAFELNYLAHIYTRTYLDAAGTFSLYFRPLGECAHRSVNVLPDFLPPGSVEISGVTVDGATRSVPPPGTFQVPLGDSDLGRTVKVVFRVLPKTAVGKPDSSN